MKNLIASARPSLHSPSTTEPEPLPHNTRTATAITVIPRFRKTILIPPPPKTNSNSTYRPHSHPNIWDPPPLKAYRDSTSGLFLLKVSASTTLHCSLAIFSTPRAILSRKFYQSLSSLQISTHFLSFQSLLQSQAIDIFVFSQYLGRNSNFSSILNSIFSLLPMNLSRIGFPLTNFEPRCFRGQWYQKPLHRRRRSEFFQAEFHKL